MSKTKAKTTLSKSPNITLRKKKTKLGYSLFLDVCIGGKRQKEYLKMYLTGDRNQDKETLKVAERIKAKRILEVQLERHGEFSRAKMNSNFVDFFEENAKKRPMRDKRKTNKWTNTLNYIKEYSGDKLSFNQISTEWLDGFKEFLLSKLKRNSAAT